MGTWWKNLKALETWFYRRMTRISWKYSVINKEVYRRMNTNKSWLIEIIHRQFEFLWTCHTERSFGRLGNNWVCWWQTSRGTPRETFLTYLSKIVNKSWLGMIRMAKKKEIWSKMCAHSNLRLRIWYSMMIMTNHIYLFV